MEDPVKRALVWLSWFAGLTAFLFLWNPVDLYLWVKAVHIMAVIAWMAGMFYLPRLFVYHVEAEIGSVQSETFKVMERRLLRVIINPAMTVSWAVGLWMAWSSDTWLSPWFHVKFTLVVALTGIHGWLSALMRAFAEDRNTRSQRFFRILNEVPTLLMIGIVIMAVVRPF